MPANDFSEVWFPRLRNDYTKIMVGTTIKLSFIKVSSSSINSIILFRGSFCLMF